MLGDERLVARVDGCQLASHSFEVFEANPIADALVLDPFAAESVGPEVEGVRRGDAPRDRVDHSRAGRPPRRVRILEERNVAAGAAFLVRVEEVVNGRVVLIHRLLDEPQSENTRVEVDVARGVAGDQRDVVNALEAHARSITSGGLSTRSAPPRTRRGHARLRRAGTDDDRSHVAWVRLRRRIQTTWASRNARCSFTISRAITSRWIWFVPS